MSRPSDPSAVERFPGAAGEISALASAAAPFLLFEQIPYFALTNGVGHLTLTAQRQIAARADHTVGCDFAVVAQLRAAPSVLQSLGSAIDGIMRLASGKDAQPERRPATVRTSTPASGPGDAAITERIPSGHGQISALASANAPFVFFDKVPFYGLADGVGRVTLVAQREIAAAATGAVLVDYVAVAHLRGGLGAFAALRQVVDSIALMATPRPSGSPN